MKKEITIAIDIRKILVGIAAVYTAFMFLNARHKKELAKDEEEAAARWAEIEAHHEAMMKKWGRRGYK